jgi:hypothetical protein
MFRTLLWCVLALLSWSTGAQSQSPYVGQEFREIKALSPQEISDYLSGKGMGLAKAAELNGYPVLRMSSNWLDGFISRPTRRSRPKHCLRECKRVRSLLAKNWSKRNAC